MTKYRVNTLKSVHSFFLFFGGYTIENRLGFEFAGG